VNVTGGSWVRRLAALGVVGLAASGLVALGGEQEAAVATTPPNGSACAVERVILTPDVSGDGRADIITPRQNGELWVYQGNGDGTLGNAWKMGSGFRNLDLYAPGDWNGDRRADLIAVTQEASAKMYLYAGQKLGQLKGAGEIGHGWSGFRIIPAGDLTQDGANDLLAITPDGVLWMYAGDGRGGFVQNAKRVGQGWAGLDLYAAGDLNNDGRNDILAVLPDGTLWSYAGRGNGTFAPARNVGRGWTGLELVTGADLNGDRLADIVAWDQVGGKAYWYRSTGSGYFAPAQEIASGWGYSDTAAVCPADQPPTQQTVTIAAAGDICFMSGGHTSLGNASTLLSGIVSEVSGADIAFANLETAVTNGGVQANKTWTFRAPPSVLGSLYNAGFDIVSLANNHALDYGASGFADTLAAFSGSALLQVGGGANKSEAFAPRFIDVGGVRIAFLAFSEITPADFAATSSRAGVAYTQSISEITAAVRSAAAQADYTLVSMHWGIENQFTPTDRQVREGRAIIDAGADVVLGGHPHVIEGIEFYGGGLINYSFGNFVFDPGRDTGNDTYILHLTLTPDGVTDVSATPVRLYHYAPRVATGATADRLLGLIQNLSRQRGTTVSLSGGRAYLS
jgi:poly-gamma-glutamate synthesis protein (capsule biosynthesis protein)